MANDITAVIFDLDGVLVDSRPLHYHSFNAALAEANPLFVIPLEEHLAKYDGLPTTKKLALLTAEKGLPEFLHDQVWRRKQYLTVELIAEAVPPAPAPLLEVLDALRSRGIRLFCCSNSITATLESMLRALGIARYFERVYSNEDVEHAKPHPQIYMKCMVDHGLVPSRTLILEDSPIGRTAATLSGAHLCPIADPEDLRLPKVDQHLRSAAQKNARMDIDTRWSSRVQVVIPMAGAGSRFAVAGFSQPKPLISIAGKPMIRWVTDNLNLNSESTRYVFVVRTEHLEDPQWDLRATLQASAPDVRIVTTDGLTEGPVCSVLLAREHLDPDVPLLIANSDQFLEWDASAFLYESKEADGCISVFEQPDPNDKKWSYVALDPESGLVLEVAEKVPISTHASTGVYYWRRAGDFVKHADAMIAKDVRVNGEFYVCPVYNEAIRAGAHIKISHCKKMWGLGVPADLAAFRREYLHDPSV
jgi:HAD superfamily hydrolase (TIGR01509 family)